MHYRSANAVAACFAAVLVACAGERSGSTSRPSRPGPAASPAVFDGGRTDTLGEVVHELSDSLWVVFQTRNGTRWFGSDGQGVYRVDGKTIVRYTTRDGLPNDQIRQILEDGSGNLFFNTCGGIARFDGRRFDTLVPVRNPTSSREWKSEPGDLWFMARDVDSGLYRYDGRLLTHLEFPKISLQDEFDAKFPNVPYSPYCVYTIHRDRRGALWFGTACFGVCRYDGRSFAWITEDELTELDPGPAPGIRGIVEDQDGRFWFSNLLHRYSVDADGLIEGGTPEPRYRKEPRVASGAGERPPEDYFMSGVTDAGGVVWIATYGSGVWRYEDGRFTHHPVLEEGRPVTLLSIYEDKDGVLWLGTHAAGAWRFDGEAFERFRP